VVRLLLSRAVVATGYKVANQAQAMRINIYLQFVGFKKAGIGLRCHIAQKYSFTFAAEQNTDHWQKKCPPQEQAFLHTFLAL